MNLTVGDIVRFKFADNVVGEGKILNLGEWMKNPMIRVLCDQPIQGLGLGDVLVTPQEITHVLVNKPTWVEC